jgi:hypothetical protein
MPKKYKKGHRAEGKKGSKKLSNINFSKKQDQRIVSPRPPVRRSRMKPQEVKKTPPTIRIERFDKAFVISLGIYALLSLLIFIPVIGPLMVATLVPYIACNRGCRYVSKLNGIQIGLLIGIIWSIIEVYLLFQFLTLIKISVADPGIYTGLDTWIIFLLAITNIIFSIIGGYTGGAKFESSQDDTPSATGSKA